jgi:hypothetical protein
MVDSTQGRPLITSMLDSEWSVIPEEDEKQDEVAQEVTPPLEAAIPDPTVEVTPVKPNAPVVAPTPTPDRPLLTPMLDAEWEVEELPEDAGLTRPDAIKKKDLLVPERLSVLRQYMVDRSGVRYKEGGPIEDEQLVEDFVGHMRYFNTNIVSTAGEVKFISGADDNKKANASQAYQIYDQLGSVFVNDGLFGAADGVKDYVFAAATDLSNYLGVVTGGLARAGSFAGGKAAKAAVKRAAVEAGQAAIKKGATQAAAKKAGQEAAERTIEKFALARVKTPAAAKAIEKAAEAERKIFLRQAKRTASTEVLEKAADKRAKRALVTTTATDAFVAMAQDYGVQQAYLEVGAQEQYSLLQTGFSSLLGLVAGGMQLAGSKGKGLTGLGGSKADLRAASGRTNLSQEVNEIISKETTLSKPLLDESAAKSAAEEIKKSIRGWRTKVEAGRKVNKGETMEAELLSRIILGSDGKGKKDGLVHLYNRVGLKMTPTMTVSDAITNTVRYLPQKELDEINSLLKPTHVFLGEMGQSRARIGDLVASEANRAGSVLNVFSQAKRAMDVNLVKAADALDQAVEGVVERESSKAMLSTGVEYGQNLWRRMLVSAPATTAANVSGFAQFSVASSIADVFTGTAYTLGALTRTGAKREEMLRIGGIYRNNVTTKMRYLMDPYTTHDAYMAFLETHEDVSKVLFETVAGGVERTAKRYGLDPDSSFFRNAEALADGANKWTGVRVQDTFTKSHMFMTELDKYLKLNSNISLSDAINAGDLSVISEDVIGAALDKTMKSVFSKDYTKQGNSLANAAKLVETISATPILGTVLPFGRFMNNVVATAWQWGPGTLVDMSTALYKGKNLEATEAMSRALVTATGLGFAMAFDQERQDKGLRPMELDVGGGTVVDFTNQYPMSLFLVVAGEVMAPELMQEVLTQVGVGQFASDFDFGNDMKNLLSILSNNEDTRTLSWNALYKQGGNIAAGFTRPLDALNRMAGVIADVDAAKDPRQATGPAVFTQTASRYFDNLIELFTQDIDAITGEELRTATREGTIRDANPMSRALGFTQKPPQTASEFVYALSEMLPYTANARSQNPQYDKMYNTLLAPALNEAAEKLMADKTFMKGTVAARRRILKSRLTEVKAIVSSYMSESAGPETFREVMVRQARQGGSSEARFAASKMMERQGVEANISDYTHKELQLFLDYVKAYDQYYK